MKLILSVGSPIEVLHYLNMYPDTAGLYFLDVGLGHEIDGIKLGKTIRDADPNAKIVFVTTHEEAAVLTFRNKIGALDFIVKDRPQDVEMRMIECIQTAYKRYLAEKAAKPKYFTVNTNGAFWNVPYDDILYFETCKDTAKRIILHMDNSEVNFRGIISDIEELVPEFYRCHKSYIVNPGKIACVNKAAKAVEMTNGATVLIAARKMSELLKMIG